MKWIAVFAAQELARGDYRPAGDTHKLLRGFPGGGIERQRGAVGACLERRFLVRCQESEDVLRAIGSFVDLEGVVRRMGEDRNFGLSGGISEAVDAGRKPLDGETLFFRLQRGAVDGARAVVRL